MTQLVIGLVLGSLIGIAAGAYRWRRAVLALNAIILEKDVALSGMAEDRNRGISKIESPPFAIGLKMYRSNKFEEAFPILLHHAEQGHGDSASLIAKMYFAGMGVEKSVEKYRFWLAKAAQEGDKSAKAKLKKLNT